MYLSRIALDGRNPEVRNALTSPQVMHAILESKVGGDNKRLLWRVDALNNQRYLLLQSATKPEVPVFDTEWQTRSYDAFLSRISNGQCWRFRLCANPIRNVKEDGLSRGKVKAYLTADEQMKWLLNKADGCGFAIPSVMGAPAAMVVHREVKRFTRYDAVVTIATATFAGELEVIDAERLVQSMQVGVGRAKAYGCGLLTLVKP